MPRPDDGYLRKVPYGIVLRTGPELFASCQRTRTELPPPLPCTIMADHITSKLNPDSNLLLVRVPSFLLTHSLPSCPPPS